MTRGPLEFCEVRVWSLKEASLLLVVIALLVGTAGCDKDRTEPRPRPTSTTDPVKSVSPPPETSRLTDTQLRVYEDAVTGYEKYQAAVDAVTADPGNAGTRRRLALGFATDPLTIELARQFDRLIRDGARTEGKRQPAWTSPVDVSSVAVRFIRCELPGSWEYVEANGRRLKPDDNSLVTVSVVRIDGDWKVKDVEPSPQGC